MAAGGYLPRAIDGALLVWPKGAGPDHAASWQVSPGPQLREQGRQQQERHRSRADRRVYLGRSPERGPSRQRRQLPEANRVQQGCDRVDVGHEQRERNRPQGKKEVDPCGPGGGGPEREPRGQRRMPVRAETIQERTSQASTWSKPMEQDQLHHRVHREEEYRDGRRGRSPGSESEGQRRMPLRAGTIPEGTVQASTRTKPARQDQLHHERRREDEGPGGCRGNSLDSESRGQRRTPPRAEPIQERTRQVSTRPETPGQAQLRREEHREEEEQPQPRGQLRPPLARRMRRAGEKVLEEGAPRGQVAEKPAPWAKGQAPRAWVPDAPQLAEMAAEQQKMDGKIARWKRPAVGLQMGRASGRTRSRKQKENKKRGERRLRIEEKWAKGAQQRKMEGSGVGPEQAPEPDGAVLEPAESPVQDLRERSRRPRDTRSQSRSHSAGRSPRR